MQYVIRFRGSAQKALEKIPEKDKQRVLAAIVSLASNPFSGKKLEGEYKGQYAIRVWPYRVIYEIYKHDLMVLVLSIGHRQGVYK